MRLPKVNIMHLLPLETMDTMTDVHVELLWTNTVNRTPSISPTTGFCNNGLSWKMLPEKKINLNIYNKYHDARQYVPQYNIRNVLEANMLICHTMVSRYFPSGWQRGDKKGRQSCKYQF